jgi:hypothetical protein
MHFPVVWLTWDIEDDSCSTGYCVGHQERYKKNGTSLEKRKGAWFGWVEFVCPGEYPKEMSK